MRPSSRATSRRPPTSERSRRLGAERPASERWGGLGGSGASLTPQTIEALDGVPVARRRVELVERKGLGHPDSICDALAEAAALALGRLYLARTGMPQHFNLDKALLAAGACEKGFGHGRITRPMELYLGDRATLRVGGAALPVEETVQEAVAGWLAAHLPRVRPARELVVRSLLRPGSEQLQGIFADPAAPVLANDTSGASGYAPLSPTEGLVLAVERYLNGPEFKRAFPDTGEDVKVFAVRADDDVAVTVAMPLIATAVPSEAAYFARREEVLAALERRFAGGPLRVEWRLNALDRPGAGAAGTYLTVIGLSAEDADSGQVGRGNRVCGLIPFSRPTSGEATAGKNGVAHIGKIYSFFSHHLAGRLYARCPGLEEVYVHLAARIGEPADRPWVGVQAVLAPGVALRDVEPAIRRLLAEDVATLPAFRADLARGVHAVP